MVLKDGGPVVEGASSKNSVLKSQCNEEAVNETVKEKPPVLKGEVHPKSRYVEAEGLPESVVGYNGDELLM